jgi:2-oxo-4-hydroxy-4-carboxy-5-ureidoimidazoline decarboxylase
VSSADVVNRLEADALRLLLAGCCRSEAWVERMLAARPWPDGDAMTGAGDRAVAGLEEDQLRAALAAEPGPAVAAAAASPRAGHAADGGHPGRTGDGGHPADGNAAAAVVALRLYHQQFGFPFPGRVHAMDADELLMRVRIRLGNDPRAELRAARDDLRRRVRSRLLALLRDDGAPPA